MGVLYALESIRTPLLDKIMLVISELGGEAPFLIIAIAVFWCIDKRKGYYLMTVGFFGMILNQFLKILCCVPRPWVKDPDFTIVEPARAGATGYSFPSGHTQNAVALYGGIARCTGSGVLRVVCIVLAVLIAFSRMYLGVHTPLDVGVSFVIATVLVLALYPLMEEVKRRGVVGAAHQAGGGLRAADGHPVRAESAADRAVRRQRGGGRRGALPVGGAVRRVRVAADVLVVRAAGPEIRRNKMNKAEMYQYLTAQGVSYEITEHKAVFSMEELDEVALPYPEWDAKNLFIRDDKKRNYYLITVKGDKRVDLKEFRRQHGLRALSFASADDLLAIMGLTPGSVTPLGLLNDEERRVYLYLDAAFAGNRIGVHPNDNTATVWMQAEELVRLVRQHGNGVEYVEL